jgi:glutamine amidotransferase
LGILPGTVDRFVFPHDSSAKIPHMGWNSVSWTQAHPVLEGIPEGSMFYFVHSYYPAPADPSLVLATTDYAGRIFASAMVRRNLIATQFHPEKSGAVGLKMLENFARWTP